MRPFDFDSEATCPRWLKFIEAFTCGDSELATTLQQWFASVLLPDIRHEKFLWLVGEGRNGKSVLVAVLGYVLGEQMIGHLSVEQLTGKHELAGLADKRLNVSQEFGKITPKLEASIKRLSSDEPIAIDEKHKPVYCAQLGLRLVFVSNLIPHVSDRSLGFWRRCLLVLCRARVKEGKENLNLVEELKDEAPGIFTWLLRGAVNLARQGGHIFVAEAIGDAVAQQRQIMDPHHVFLREELVSADHGKWIPGVEVLYEVYRQWMRARGHSGALSWPHFKTLLKDEYPQIESVRRRHPVAGRAYGYSGITWKVAAEQEEAYAQVVADRLAKKHAVDLAREVQRDVLNEVRRAQANRHIQPAVDDGKDDGGLDAVLRELEGE